MPRVDRAVHRRRHLDRMRNSRFPLAGRALDQEPADPVRRISGEPGDARRSLAAALRHGGAVSRRRSPAGAIARSPASIAPAKCPALITQNIDNLHQASGIARGRRRRTARQHDLRHLPRLREALRIAWVKEKFDARASCAPDCAMRRLHQDRDGLVRPGDAG